MARILKKNSSCPSQHTRCVMVEVSCPLLRQHRLEASQSTLEASLSPVEDERGGHRSRWGGPGGLVYRTRPWEDSVICSEDQCCEAHCSRRMKD